MPFHRCTGAHEFDTGAHEFDTGSHGSYSTASPPVATAVLLSSTPADTAVTALALRLSKTDTFDSGYSGWKHSLLICELNCLLRYGALVSAFH